MLLIQLRLAIYPLPIFKRHRLGWNKCCLITACTDIDYLGQRSYTSVQAIPFFIDCFEMRGTYVLLIEVNKSSNIQVGKRRNYKLEAGYYAYVGSALSNLDKRIERHLNTHKKLFWHIDYLLQFALVKEAIYVETNEKVECLVAQNLSKKLVSKLGFGCGDCNCSSHLFFNHDFNTLREAVLNSFNTINLIPSESVP